MDSSDHDFVLVEDSDTVEEYFHKSQPLPREEIQKIRSWLKPTDYAADSSEYKRHLHSYISGTNAWIRESQYQQWIGSPKGGLLWIKAIPGAGKSVAAAQIVNHYLKRQDTLVLYFFFRQIIASNREPAALLRDWVAQAIDHSPRLQDELKTCCDKDQKCESIPLEELWEKLTRALCDFPRAICVADALDEMSMGHDRFIEMLAKLGELQPATVKVCLTSRPVPRIERLLKRPFINQLTLSPTLLRPSLAKYIENRLVSLPMPQLMREKLEEQLISRANGLFLYVKLMMDKLLEPQQPEPVLMLDELANLPTGLPDMYTRMLLEHSVRSKVPQRLQIAIIRWVTHSARALRVIELAAIVDLLTTNELLEDVTELRAIYPNTKAMIRVACGPLIEILEDETVSIIHHSLTEYIVDLVRDGSTVIELSAGDFPTICSRSSHREMAITCLQELTSDWAEDLHIEGEAYYWLASQPTQKYAERPFLNYAGRYWPYHVRHVNDDDVALFVLLDLVLNPTSHHFQKWRYLSHENYPKRTTALHLAASQGFTPYINYLIRSKLNVNEVNDYGETPLHLAATFGHTEAVRSLLNSSANPLVGDVYGHTPLHLAVDKNHADVVRTMLEAGMNPATLKMKGKHGRIETVGYTAIRYAFKRKHGHPETALAFLPYLKPDDLSQAVFWAAEKGRSDTVIAILNHHQVDVNQVLGGENLVFVAVSNHDIRLLEQLIELGALLEVPMTGPGEPVGKSRLGIECKSGSTLLHTFARGCLQSSLHDKAGRARSKRMLQILLQSGLEINARDSEAQTPLHIAINEDRYDREADHEIVEMFLDYGADACARSLAGLELLHLQNKSDAILRSLLKRGANPNARSGNSHQTPLHRCIDQDLYNEDRLKTLLEYGADCNAADVHGDTPLHYVTRDHSWKDARIQIETLLNHGACPRARNHKRETPLHTMRPWDSNSDNISVLVKAGTEIQAKDIEGKTALMRMRNGSNEPPYRMVDAMLASGAEMDARDYEVCTFLHHVCTNPYSVKMAPELVKRGANPSAVDFTGNNIFHYLARLGRSSDGAEKNSLLRLAHGLGVDPNVVNHLGQLPLHVAAGSRHGPSWVAGISVIEFFLGPICNSDINAVDNSGNAAVHLAATICDQRVAALISKGADPCLVNFDGQTLLHIASRARESNSVGLVSTIYSSRARDVFSDTDHNGRTALHYACRSGRVESVRILLEAGANPNHADHEGLNPLCACAEFPEEDQLWRLAYTATHRPRFTDAAAMSPNDSNRPRRPGDRHDDVYGQRSKISLCDESVGIRQIIRLLLKHGAEVTPQNQGSQGDSNARNALVYAIEQGCEVLLDELSNTQFEIPRAQLSPRQSYLERYFIKKFCDAGESLNGLLSNQPDDSTKHRNQAELFRSLLQTENEKGILKFFEQGGETTAAADPDRPSAMLIKHGYSDLLSKVVPNVERTHCKDWDQFRLKLAPALRQACSRDLPNLEVLRVLVEEKHYDFTNVEKDHPFTKDTSPLHILAESSHWWKAQGIDYLALHGANVDIKDLNSHTPLYVAVENQAIGNAETLLRHGADPNVITKNGLTCLNKAASSPEMTHLLLAHGASVTVGRYPFIFEAINLVDVKLVALILQSEANLDSGFKAEQRSGRFDDRPLKYVYDIQYYNLDVVHPLHLAASKVYNKPEKRAKMTPVIELLVQHGADPLKACSPGHTILHELCKNEGIIEPILQSRRLDVEYRDGEGNTLFLAACCARTSRDDRIAYIKSLTPLTTVLLGKGARIDATNYQKQNALHLLFSQQGLNFRDLTLLDIDLQAILAAPQLAAMINQPDNHGITPLLCTLQYHPSSDIGHFVDTLLSNGANPLALDNEGNTALHHIVRKLGTNPKTHYGPTDTFIRFLNTGIAIDTRNKSGETVLFAALRSNYLSPNGLAFYLEHGANLHDTNDIGQNLLHVVAGKPHRTDAIFDAEEREADVDAWKYLVESGLDPAEEDGEQRSAWDLAVAAGNKRILGFVESSG